MPDTLTPFDGFVRWLADVTAFCRGLPERLSDCSSAHSFPDVNLLLVLPNEALDLDSVASSLSFAYAMYAAHNYPSAVASSPSLPSDDAVTLHALQLPGLAAGAKRCITVPVFPIVAEDFALRLDSKHFVRRLFRSYAQNSSSQSAQTESGPVKSEPEPGEVFLFADSLSTKQWDALAHMQNCFFAFTDHNVQATEPLKRFLGKHAAPRVSGHATAPTTRPSSEPASRVLAVLDHHVDAGLFTESATLRWVSPLGSACSVVVTALFCSMFRSHSTSRSDISSEISSEIHGGGCSTSQSTGKKQERENSARRAIKWLFPCSDEATATQNTPGGVFLGDLLAAAIVTDTVNLDVRAHKVRIGDLAALDVLGKAAWVRRSDLEAEACISYDVSHMDEKSKREMCVDKSPVANDERDALFRFIQLLRARTDDLTLQQLLRMDLKWVRSEK